MSGIWIKRWIATFGLSLILACLAACSSGTQQSEDVDYADDEVMPALASALEDRFDLADQKAEQSSARLMQLTQIEIDALAPFRSREFEDSKLQETTLAYVNLLEDMNDLAADYDANGDAIKQDWDEKYSDRAEMLNTFVSQYSLAVDESHAKALDDLVRRGRFASEQNAVAKAIESLAAGMVFEKEDNGFGYCSYSCVAENTSDYNFGRVTLLLSLYDVDGVKADETYASTNSWEKGEKVRFEATSDVSAVEVKVSVSNYEVQ